MKDNEKRIQMESLFDEIKGKLRLNVVDTMRRAEAAATGTTRAEGEIKKELEWYVENIGTPTLWDALYYLTGRYGSISTTHLQALKHLQAEGLIEEE